MAGVMLILVTLIGDLPTIIVIILVGGTGALSYLAACALLRLEALRFFITLLRTRLQR